MVGQDLIGSTCDESARGAIDLRVRGKARVVWRKIDEDAVVADRAERLPLEPRAYGCDSDCIVLTAVWPGH
eukprot:788282-Prymnesium_polylepis.1